MESAVTLVGFTYVIQEESLDCNISISKQMYCCHFFRGNNFTNYAEFEDLLTVIEHLKVQMKTLLNVLVKFRICMNNKYLTLVNYFTQLRFYMMHVDDCWK